MCVVALRNALQLCERKLLRDSAKYDELHMMLALTSKLDDDTMTRHWSSSSISRDGGFGCSDCFAFGAAGRDRGSAPRYNAYKKGASNIEET